MSIKATDINFFLSGGTNNSNPNNSIGGIMSGFPVIGSINNLFNNITSEEAKIGKIDFRCFYIRNTSSSHSLNDAKVYILSQKSTGSKIQLGIAKVTDEQEIRISGSVISGDLIFRYRQQEMVIPWDNSLNNFSSNLLNGFNSIGVSGIELNPSLSVSSFIVKIIFKGNEDNRNNPLLEIVSNNLTGITKPIVALRKTKIGQPINSVAPNIAAETIIPDKVQFFDTSADNEINIGTLRPGDFLPIWIKRNTVPETNFEEKDYFIFKIKGSPFL